LSLRMMTGHVIDRATSHIGDAFQPLSVRIFPPRLMLAAKAAICLILLSMGVNRIDLILRCGAGLAVPLLIALLAPYMLLCMIAAQRMGAAVFDLFGKVRTYSNATALVKERTLFGFGLRTEYPLT
jgi:hypothetical protein